MGSCPRACELRGWCGWLRPSLSPRNPAWASPRSQAAGRLRTAGASGRGPFLPGCEQPPGCSPVHLALSTHPLQAHVRAAPLPREASAVKRGPVGAGAAGSLVQLTPALTLNSGLTGWLPGPRELGLGPSCSGSPSPWKQEAGKNSLLCAQELGFPGAVTQDAGGGGGWLAKHQGAAKSVGGWMGGFLTVFSAWPRCKGKSCVFR